MKRPYWAGENLSRVRARMGRRLAVVIAVVALLSSCVSQVTTKQTAQLYYDLGNAYAQLGEQDKATAAYLNALKYDRSLLQASYNLARVYIESGNFAKAIALLDGLLVDDPENLIVLDTLGFAYYKKGDQTKALAYYDRALSLSPTNENALFNRGTVLAEQGQNQQAIEAFRQLYKINSDASLLLTLGKLEIATGKLEQAIHDLEAYRVAKPDDFTGLKLLAGAYRREKLYAKALNAYDAALAVKPDAADVLFAKADILLTAIQDTASGLTALKAAVAAGFKDHQSIDTLLANPDLVDKHAVQEILNSGGQPGGRSSPGSPNASS